MKISQNRVVDKTSTPEVHLVSSGGKKESAKSLTNNPLNCSSKDWGIYCRQKILAVNFKS